MMKLCTRQKVALVLIILVLCFIWGQSLLDPDSSEKESGFVFNLLYPYLYRIFGEVNATHHLVRKLAHYTEYAALGACLTLFFGYEQKGMLRSMNIALLTALFDESIQLLSKRGSQIQDVWLDFAGAVTGILVAAALFWIVVQIKNRRSGEDGSDDPDSGGESRD